MICSVVRKIWEPKRMSVTSPHISASIFSQNVSNSCSSCLSSLVNRWSSSNLTLLGFLVILGGASTATISCVRPGSQMSQQDRVFLENSDCSNDVPALQQVSGECGKCHYL